MATLFNTKISQTYPSLLKTIDNAALSATLRELTDGSGNQSGLFLNTAGDFKVSAILEWGSLKDTGTGVTITQFVTAANGIENFNNDTTLPTSAAVKLYVDTKFSQTDTLTEVLGFGNTTSGKDIAVSAGDDITFTDTSKILLGNSQDLKIYHSGSNSFIEDSGSGGLRILSNEFRVYNQAQSELIINAVENGAVELYYDNTKRFETTTDGSKVSGNLVVTGTITGSGGSFLPLAGGTMTGNIILNDNVKTLYGTSGDLELYYNGTDAYLDNYNGNINIVNRSNDKDIIFQSDNGSGGLATYILIDGSTGAVELSHYGFKKFETTSSGVSVSGNLTINGSTFAFGNITYYDNVKALFGDASDLQIYHDGTNSYIDETGIGDLRIKSTLFRVQSSTGEAMINASENGIVQLYENNVERFRTVSDGAKVTGNLEVTGTITGAGGSFLPLAGGTMTGNLKLNDNVRSIYGTNNDLEIYNDGANSFIQDVGAGSLFFKTNGAGIFLKETGGETLAQFLKDGAVNLYHNNVLKFATTSTGISVIGGGNFTGNVTVPDNANLIAGSNSDFAIIHDTNDTRLKNNTGGLYIDQIAITKSIFFRVSNANAVDTTALTINREGDASFGADVTIAGDLTVNGTTTTINTQTLSVEDPLIELAKANAANSLDIGFYGKYNDGTARYLGLFNDASDSNKFKLFKGTTIEPTTTVNTSGLGYVAADLVIANLEALGNVIASGTSSTFNTGNTGQIVTNDGNDGGYPRITIPSSSAQLGLFRSGGSAGGMYIGADSSGFQLMNASFSTKFSVSQTGTGLFTGRLGVGEATSGIKFLVNATTQSDIATFKNDNGTITLGKIANQASIDLASGNGIRIRQGAAVPFTLGTSGQVNLTQSLFGVGAGFTGAAASGTPLFTIENNSGSTATSFGLLVKGGGGSSSGKTFEVRDSSGNTDFLITGDGYSQFNGVLDTQNGVRNADGTEANPSYTFASDIDLGMYRSGANSLGFSTGGDLRLTIDSSGNILQGTNTDVFNIIGRSKVGYVGFDDAAGFAHLDRASTSDYALLQSSDGTTFLNAATSTPINFRIGHSNKMTLDSSGNLLINTNTTTYDAAKIGTGHKFLNVQAPADQYAVATLAGDSGTNGNRIGYLTFPNENNSASYKYSAWMGAEIEGTTANQQGGRLIFSTAVDGATNGPIERMRLNDLALQITTGAPNKGVIQMSTSSSYQIRGGGNYGYLSLVAPIIRFDTAGTERLRITNAGEMQLKSSSDGNKFIITSSSGSNNAIIEMGQTGSDGFLDVSATGGGVVTHLSGFTGFASYFLSNVVVGGTAVDTAGSISLQTNGIIRGVLSTGTVGDTLFNAISGVSNGCQFRNDSSNNQEYLFHNISQITLAVRQSGVTLGSTNNNTTLNTQQTLLAGYGAIDPGTSNLYGSYGWLGFNSNNNYTGSARQMAFTNAYLANQFALIMSPSNQTTPALGSGGELTNGDLVFHVNNAKDFMFGKKSGDANGPHLKINSYAYSTVFQGSSTSNILDIRSGTQQNANVGMIRFIDNGGVQCGQIISNSATTTTQYLSGSDYRLKEDLKDFAGLDKVSKIKVYDFKWKKADERSYGVLAHELDEVLPQAVNGEKDGEDTQMVDYSKIVPLLVKSIQELKAEIELLKAK